MNVRCRSFITGVNFWRGEQGSFTIEAAFIFPLVLLCTAAVLFLAVQLYQASLLSSVTGLTADRIADSWDNSFKDPVTGAFPLGSDDGLYWRLTQDGMSDVFGLVDRRDSLFLPGGTETSGDTLTVRKLRRASGMFPDGASAELVYRNHWLDRIVSVNLRRPTPFPDFVKRWFKGDQVTAASTSRVTDPVEIIRLTDMTLSYGKRLQTFLKSPESQNAFQSGSSPPQTRVTIRSEAEARIYLLRLVNGRSVNFETETVGEYRKIDALDADGIAHEAKYTVNQSDARQQILKEAELIRKGKIKGSVWHFFKNLKTGTTGLTPALRRDLENHGIMIVVHE
jgi:hypothetical protein